MRESAETKLLEMVLPESKVLDKLNAVSTAKRLATMVSSSVPADRPMLSDRLDYRSYMILTLGKEKRYSS